MSPPLVVPYILAVVLVASLISLAWYASKPEPVVVLIVLEDHDDGYDSDED